MFHFRGFMVSHRDITTDLFRLDSLTFQGVDLDVAKLYPEVSFPVSRGTPPLASLATWNHEDVYYFGFKFRAIREASTTQLDNNTARKCAFVARTRRAVTGRAA